MNFEFTVKEMFKLSTGTIALVGLMHPEDYPLITLDDYEVEIIDQTGKKIKINKISEDIFARSNIHVLNKFRSLQIFENIDDVYRLDKSKIVLHGHKRDKI